MDIILNRRSVRKFDLNKMIPYEDLIDLIKHGEAAGSARRQKSREYIIIENKDFINKLSEIYVKSSMLVKECNQMIAVIGKTNEDLPCVPFVPTDCALATQNIMDYAVSKGIGSVMLGTYPDKERLSKTCELLNLDKDKFVFTFICLGYPIDKENAFYDMNKFDEKIISHIK